jgi:tetratricopeptide (TPR) repeat protein
MSRETETLLSQALQARREGRPLDARRDLVAAIALCRQADDALQLASALTALGQIERDLQNLDAARRHYEEAVALYRTQDNPLQLAHAIRHLGDIHRHAGQREAAESCCVEALSLYRNDQRTAALELANAIRSMAILQDEAGHSGQSRPLWTEARSLYAAVNVKEGVDECSRRLTVLNQKSTRE